MKKNALPPNENNLTLTGPVQIGGFVFQPEDVPPELLGQALITQEQGRIVSFHQKRVDLEKWKGLVVRIGQSRDALDRAINGALLKIIRTEQMVVDYLHVLQQTLEQVDRRIKRGEDGKPTYSEPNLRGAGEISALTTLQLDAIPRSFNISRVEGFGQHNLELPPPDERQVFLASQSTQIPDQKRDEHRRLLLSGARNVFGTWAHGTEILTLTDIFTGAEESRAFEAYCRTEVRELEQLRLGIDVLRDIDDEEGVRGLLTQFDVLPRVTRFQEMMARFYDGTEFLKLRGETVNHPNIRALSVAISREEIRRRLQRAKQRRLAQGEKADNALVSSRPGANEWLLTEALKRKRAEEEL